MNLKMKNYKFCGAVDCELCFDHFGFWVKKSVYPYLIFEKLWSLQKRLMSW